MTERQIVAIGGAGFAEDSQPLLAFLLGLTGAERPRVVFLPTASGDAAVNTVAFHDSFGPLGCEHLHVELFGKPERERIREQILASHAVYVGGGNTANMLAVWRLHGVDEALREAWERGVVLSGTSAGANCWFEACTTDSFGPVAALHDGLGFLAGSFCPHYDGEVDRRPAYRRLVADGLPPGYAADDAVALHFLGTELAEAVTARRGSHGYRVEPPAARFLSTKSSLACSSRLGGMGEKGADPARAGGARFAGAPGSALHQPGARRRPRRAAHRELADLGHGASRGGQRRRPCAGRRARGASQRARRAARPARAHAGLRLGGNSRRRCRPRGRAHGVAPHGASRTRSERPPRGAGDVLDVQPPRADARGGGRSRCPSGARSTRTTSPARAGSSGRSCPGSSRRAAASSSSGTVWRAQGRRTPSVRSPGNGVAGASSTTSSTPTGSSASTPTTS